MKTKWRFYKPINLTVFAASPKGVPLGCKDPVVPELLFKKFTINCLTFQEIKRQPDSNNLCLFRPLSFHWHGNQRLEEEASKFFASFMSRMERLSPSQFQGVHMNDYPILEALLWIDNLLSDIKIVEGNILRELVWRSVQKHENNVRVLRYNNPICYMSNINAVFQSFRCPHCVTFSTEHPMWNNIWLHAVNEWKMTFRRTYIKSEKLSLTSWTVLVLKTRVKKNYWKS